MVCLDTNAVIAAINQRAPWVRQRLEQAIDDHVVVGIPSVVLYEMWYGIRKGARPEANLAVLANFLALDVTVWPFEADHAEEAGDIRAVLERAGTPHWPLRHSHRRTSATSKRDLDYGK
jgi:tRNA(fMet)-specific endonuclease VapC